MNYYKPTQRTDGRWDYACHNRRTGSHAVGYCTSPEFIRKMLDNEISAYLWAAGERERYEADLAAGKYHDNGHAIAEEASACYRRYELDHRTRYFTVTSQHHCRECGAWTDKCVEIGNVMMFSLCEQHQTREILEKLVPLPGERWSSY